MGVDIAASTQNRVHNSTKWCQDRSPKKNKKKPTFVCFVVCSPRATSPKKKPKKKKKKKPTNTTTKNKRRQNKKPHPPTHKLTHINDPLIPPDSLKAEHPQQVSFVGDGWMDGWRDGWLRNQNNCAKHTQKKKRGSGFERCDDV